MLHILWKCKRNENSRFFTHFSLCLSLFHSILRCVWVGFDMRHIVVYELANALILWKLVRARKLNKIQCDNFEDAKPNIAERSLNESNRLTNIHENGKSYNIVNREEEWRKKTTKRRWRNYWKWRQKKWREIECYCCHFSNLIANENEFSVWKFYLRAKWKQNALTLWCGIFHRIFQLCCCCYPDLFFFFFRCGAQMRWFVFRHIPHLPHHGKHIKTTARK